MDAGESITIKAWYSDDDRQRVLSAAVEQIRGADGSAVTRATLDRARATKRALAVQGWTLLADDGQPLPFDEDTLLHALPSDLCDWLDGEIDVAWDGLGTPVTSKDQAERLEQEAKEQRSQFRRDGLPSAQGPDAGGTPHERGGASDLAPNGAGAAPAPAVEAVRDRPLDPTELPGPGLG